MFISDPELTASKNCKLAGFKSLKEVVDISGFKATTFWRYLQTRPFVFDAILNHAIEVKKIDPNFNDYRKFQADESKNVNSKYEYYVLLKKLGGKPYLLYEDWLKL